MYKIGHKSPINDIGQKSNGLIYGDKYERINRNRMIEFKKYKNLFVNDNPLILFLTCAKKNTFFLIV
jgi:hypothetical protein